LKVPLGGAGFELLLEAAGVVAVVPLPEEAANAVAPTAPPASIAPAMAARATFLRMKSI